MFEQINCKKCGQPFIPIPGQKVCTACKPYEQYIREPKRGCLCLDIVLSVWLVFIALALFFAAVKLVKFFWDL